MCLCSVRREKDAGSTWCSWRLWRLVRKQRCVTADSHRCFLTSFKSLWNFLFLMSQHCGNWGTSLCFHTNIIGNNPISWLQEKERLKKEKKDEKRLNKQRKLELRRLELEKAKELKKPNEDMCLADLKVFTHCGAVGTWKSESVHITTDLHLWNTCMWRDYNFHQACVVVFLNRKLISIITVGAIGMKIRCFDRFMVSLFYCRIQK